MTPRVSVVVPTFRRPAMLDRCLEALCRQTLSPSSYEIMVVDDGQDEATRLAAEKWRQKSRVEVRYLRTSRTGGPAAARNAGWRAARGNIIAFTDDDCIPRSDWLEAGTKIFVDGIVGAWGRTEVPVSPDPTDYELDASRLTTAQFVTANCFYRRDAIAAAGGFDEQFTMAWREDSDLHYRVEKIGKLAEAPEAMVLHPVRRAPWGISLRQQKKSMFNALLYRKHPELYWRRIQPSPPWHYYQIVTALLAAIGFGLAGRTRPALLSAGLWGFLTGRFCARRLQDTSRMPLHVAEMVMTSVLIPPLSIFWRLWGAIKFRVFFL